MTNDPYYALIVARASHKVFENILLIVPNIGTFYNCLFGTLSLVFWLDVLQYSYRYPYMNIFACGTGYKYLYLYFLSLVYGTFSKYLRDFLSLKFTILSNFFIFFGFLDMEQTMSLSAHATKETSYLTHILFLFWILLLL